MKRTGWCAQRSSTTTLSDPMSVGLSPLSNCRSSSALENKWKCWEGWFCSRASIWICRSISLWHLLRGFHIRRWILRRTEGTGDMVSKLMIQSRWLAPISGSFQGCWWPWLWPVPGALQSDQSGAGGRAPSPRGSAGCSETVLSFKTKVSLDLKENAGPNLVYSLWATSLPFTLQRVSFSEPQRRPCC